VRGAHVLRVALAPGDRIKQSSWWA
jgi:hypothetical protein